jgi:DNA-directed RNA polymerase specialized sigma24 family protein
MDTAEMGRVEALWQDPAYSVDPEQVSQRAALCELLGQLVERLTTMQRRVLVLHDVHGVATSEIAKAWRMPLPTVKSHLRRARMAMVTMLAEQDVRDQGAQTADEESSARVPRRGAVT